MKRFKTQFSTQSIKRPPAWTERMAAVLGGLSIILLGLMALPLLLLLILVVQVRRLFSSPKKNQEVVFPDWPWDTFFQNDDIQVERKLNHGLEKYADENKHLGEEIEFGDFVAYGIRTSPDIPEFHGLYFDYCFQVLEGGLLLRGLSPVAFREKDPVYFLDFRDKKLLTVDYIPANTEVEMVSVGADQISVQGRVDHEKFELKIRIIEAD